jgi:hypothetical protein
MLRGQLLHTSGAELQQLRQRIRVCEKGVSDLFWRPLTQGAAINITAVPVARLPAAECGPLAELLRRPVLDRIDWMCWPVYRDALVFYDLQGRLMSVLSICFECERMCTKWGGDVAADVTVYQDLKILLQQLGHPVE